MIEKNNIPYGKLNNLLKLSLNWFVISIVMSSISAVFLVLQFIILAHMINHIVFENMSLMSQKQLLIGFVCVVLLQVISKILSDISGTRAGIKITQIIRQNLYSHLYKTGENAYKHIPIGEMVNTLTEGIDNLIPYFARYIPSAAMMVIIPFFILAVVINVDIWSFIILACTGPLIPIFMAFVGYSAQFLMDKQWQQLSILSGSFLDILRGLKTLRLFGRAVATIDYIDHLANEYRKTTLSVMKVAFLTSAVLEFFSSLSIAVIAVVFGTRLLNGTVTFQSAFLVLLLAPEYFMPLRNFSASYHARQNANAALEQLKKIYELPELVVFRDNGNMSVQPIQTVMLDNVTVYSVDGATLLHDITCSFSKDQLSILVGASGAGKTTLLNVILGFIPIVDGEMKFLNTQQNLISLESVKTAWVPQRPLMLFGTIKDNLCLGCPNSTLDALKQVAEQAGILSFIESLPNGFDTNIGENGQKLSGGQIRRLILARALLTHPDILILDEPTAGLDRENALNIIQTIQSCKQDRIVIVATHNAELTLNYDQLLEIDQGEIIKTADQQGIKA